MAEKVRGYLARITGIAAPANEPEKGEVESVAGASGKESRELSVEQAELEQAELLKTLESQHPQMRAALERVKISTEGIPSWEAVKAGLTPEVLDKALKMEQPTLLMVPPTTRQSKVEASNKNPAQGQKHDTYIYELKSNDLWNGGRAKTENRWRVAIAEGTEDVMPDPQITDGEKTNYQMAKAYVEKYAKDGLDVINDADTYLSLMLKALAEGKPVDPKSFTVLNAKNVAETSYLARGFWNGDLVNLDHTLPGDSNDRLRLRSLVWVDPQQA